MAVLTVSSAVTFATKSRSGTPRTSSKRLGPTSAIASDAITWYRRMGRGHPPGSGGGTTPPRSKSTYCHTFESDASTVRVSSYRGPETDAAVARGDGSKVGTERFVTDETT